MESGRVFPTVAEASERLSLENETSVEDFGSGSRVSSMYLTLGRALASLATIFSLHRPVHLLSLSSKYGLRLGT